MRTINLLLGLSCALLASCATVNVSSDDDDDESDSTTSAVPCTEENAEEQCGDPALCVDGYCCDTTCEGACDACDLDGLEGTCSVVPSGEVCRAAAGICDAEETCDGESADCPADELFGSEQACRPAASDCDVAEFCDGESADGCPEDTFAEDGAACGDTTETECDLPDTCDGAGACQDNFEPEETACGDSTETECDAPDSCDGAGACQDNFEPDTVPCGDSTDTDCDAPDTCDGAGACSPNFDLEDTPCGDSTDTTCDHADTCDGAGACLQNLAADTTVCRAAVNDCDFAEYCDGYGTCPGDVTKNPGDACGDPSDTECTNPDTCDSSLVCQPNHELSTVPCSTATACEIASHCDGAGGCGGGGFMPEDTPCGSSLDTQCDDPDSCDDSGNCLDNHVALDTPCGDSTDNGCTDPDTCDGDGNCQENHELPGTACGSPANTDCTNPDTCNGAGACLENHEIPGTACGDPTETTCNHADTCNSSGVCAQNFEPTTTVCRPAAAGGCDVAENCASGGTCPADAFALPGTNCGSGPTECSGQDTCDGGGGCLPNNYPTTTTCGTTVNQYQCSSAACGAIPQGRTVGQHCEGGSCVNDTGVPWTNLDTACASDEICMANTSNAWCDWCDALPDDYCSGGNAYHYSGVGSCSGGGCSYTPTMETCTAGCAGGECLTCPGSIWASNGHCYWYVSTGATWDAAESACAAQGGHLASITSSAENDFARGVAAGDFWIGLRDNSTEDLTRDCDDCTSGCWINSNGGTYRGNTYGYDDIVPACGSWDWYDDVLQLTVTTAQYWVFSLNGSNYDTLLDLRNWSSGSGYTGCVGSSVECDDDDGPGSTSMIIRNLSAGSYTLVIDGYDDYGDYILAARRFTFSNGDAHSWHAWAADEPNGITEDCVEVYDTAGTWNDLPCTSSLPYVCESVP